MTKAEIIEYLYDNNVRADITIEQIAEDLADRKTEPTISKMEQVDEDINVRSKTEPQTDGYISGEDFMKIFNEPQTERRE